MDEVDDYLTFDEPMHPHAHTNYEKDRIPILKLKDGDVERVKAEMDLVHCCNYDTPSNRFKSIQILIKWCGRIQRGNKARGLFADGGKIQGLVHLPKIDTWFWCTWDWRGHCLTGGCGENWDLDFTQPVP